MSNYKPYPAYKVSENKWLGEIPKHWDSLANKYIFKIRKDLVGNKSSNYTLLSLTLNGIVKRDMVNPKGKFPAEFDTYQEVRKGDFVFCLFDVEETPRTVGLSNYDGMITGAYTVMSIQQQYDNRFLYYFYLNLDVKKRLKPLYRGLRNIVPKESFLSYKSFIPPKAEQTAIANFLDRKTAEIKAFIELKEKAITLLKERKTAIINQAVTKGLDPNVEMKDSGVEWLGEIPAHWEVKKLKYLMSIKGRVGWKALTASEYVSNGYVFLATPNIKNKEIDFEDVNYITKQRYDESPELILKVGDVLLTKDGSTVGTVNVVRDLPRPSTVNSSIAVLRNSSGELISEFCYYLIKSNYISELINFKKTGMGVPHLFQSDIKEFVMVLPSIKEQERIVKFVISRVNKLDDLIYNELKEITLIKEYQQSLISDAVTGKIDIREYQIKN